MATTTDLLAQLTTAVQADQQTIASQQATIKQLQAQATPQPQPQPTPSPGTPTFNASNVGPCLAVHCCIPSDLQKKILVMAPQNYPIIQWTIGSNSKPDSASRQGFNFALTFRDIGHTDDVVLCWIDGVLTYLFDCTFAEMKTNAIRTLIKDGTDLATLKPGYYTLDRGANAIISESPNWTDVSIVGDSSNTVIYIGKQFNWSLVTGDRIHLEGFRIVNGGVNHKDPNSRKSTCNFMAPGDDTTIENMEIVGFNDAFNSNNRPTRNFFRNNTITNPVGNAFWCETTQGVYYDNVCLDSDREHCFRSQNFYMIALDGNKFRNANHMNDTDPNTRDPYNDSKGTIVNQNGTLVYRHNNDLMDDIAGRPGNQNNTGIGPLEVPSGGNLNDRLNGAMVVNDKCVRGVELHCGLDGFRVVGTKIATFWLNDARGIRNGSVPLGTSIPLGTSASLVSNVKATELPLTASLSSVGRVVQSAMGRRLSSGL